MKTTTTTTGIRLTRKRGEWGWGRPYVVLLTRSQTSGRSDDVSPLSNGRLCVGARETIPRTFANSVGLL